MSDHTSTSAAGGDQNGRPRPAPGQGFFDWVRRLGIQRGDAWIGGVCGGVAARLGIDPLIVRGIAVVVALLGGPAFLLYAIAWLLLPDTQGSIHLERLIGGVFDAATAGVLVFAVLAFLPVAQGVWWAAGWPFGAGAGWAPSLGKVFWTLVVVAAIVALVVWLSRRRGWGGPEGPDGSPWGWGGPDSGYGAASGEGGGDAADDVGAAWAPGAGATPAAGGGAASAAGGGAASAAGGGAASAAEEPAAGSRPPGYGGPGDVADWRARQDEWRRRYDSWKVEQAETAQQRRERRQAQQADAAKWQADALERARLQRLGNPRTSGPYVAVSLGLALIAGAVVAAASWGNASLHPYQVVYGAAAATVVVGLAMVVAGLMRRRSGFLAFCAAVLTVITVTQLPFVGQPTLDEFIHLPYYFLQ